MMTVGKLFAWLKCGSPAGTLAGQFVTFSRKATTVKSWSCQ